MYATQMRVVFEENSILIYLQRREEKKRIFKFIVVDAMVHIFFVSFARSKSKYILICVDLQANEKRNGLGK